MESDCIFCQIVSGKIPCHKIWEDSDYLAFLTIFPNTPGFSVVIPKEHQQSYIFAAPESVRAGLLEAATKVAQKIDRAFPDVGRTGLIFEGFGVNHLHAKLFPMHGTGNMTTWKPVHSKERKFFEIYEGYLSSHDGERMDDEKLAEIARQIFAA